MSRVLVIRFTSDLTAVERVVPAGEAAHVTTLSQLPLRPSRLRRLGAFERIALVGSPPRDGIGYCFAPLVVAVLRPRTIESIDPDKGRKVCRGLLRYLAAQAAPATLQVAVSALALPALACLAALLRIRPPEGRRTASLGRVLYLRPLVGMSSSVGGAVTHTHEVIRALGKAGVAVDALTTDPGIAETAAREPSPACAWRVVRAPWLLRALPASFSLGGDLLLLLSSLREARSADAIYQRHTRFSLAGPLASRVLRRPLFLEYNSPADFFRTGRQQPLTRLRALCERVALTTAARVVVVSEVAKRQVCDLGVPAERIVVNPNGVDVRRFVGGGEDVRRQRGIADDEVVFGFVGSFGSFHGAPVLARAFARVEPELPAARLLLVGEGEELIEVQTTLGGLLESGRAISEGRVDPGEIPALLDACDVLVSPHVPLAGGVEFFGSPTKLFEYMAAGKAIVASRLGQIGDVLEDGRSALLVAPGDESELADAMRRLASDGGLRARLGAAARRDAEEFHGWRRNAERLVAVFPTIPAA